MLDHDQLLALQLDRLNREHRRRLHRIDRRHRLFVWCLSPTVLLAALLPELILWWIG